MSGSSPHTRGAQYITPSPSLTSRIIPAYAGSTPGHHSASFTARDHPRIRGEHVLVTLRVGVLAGSSPHTRGALCHQCRRRPRGRDHPRIRGEHDLMVAGDGVFCGSSPHTRGALRDTAAKNVDTRIIPAYAGSTWSIRRAAGRARGSSPHTRGARQAIPEHGVRQRIIPAYAGSTYGHYQSSAMMSDHPRIRGEHVPLVCDATRELGSSPHTRGALILNITLLSGGGIIPAYAGSTHYCPFPVL